MKRFIIVSILTCFFSAQLLQAQTVYPIDDIATLQTKVNEVGEGDIIQLSNIFPEALAETISLTISHGNSFVIDGNGKEYTMNGVSRFFIINKGFASSTGKVVLRNFHFKGIPGKTGGGITIAENSFGTIRIENSSFIDIKSAALILYNLDKEAIVEVENTTFRNNATGGHGGAIYVAKEGNLVVNQCVFDGNRNGAGGWSGGAIGLFNYLGSAVIKNSIFLNNQTGKWGGAIGVHNNSATNGSLLVDNCYFEGNKTPRIDGNCDGGAISIYSTAYATKFELRNSTFYNNIAGDDGGAVFIENPVAGASNKIMNCTMFSNWSEDVNVPVSSGFNVATSGGAIQASLKTIVEIENSTIVQNYTKSTYKRGGGLGVHLGRDGAFILAPTYNLKNNIILDNYILDGTQKYVDNYSNLAPVSLGGKFNNLSTSNIGFDNGSAVKPTGATLENVLGTTTPSLADNHNTIKAGNPNETDSPFYRIIPTISILPNDTIEVNGSANGKAVKIDGAKDARGYDRDPELQDIGAVEIYWAKFDANGGAWNAPTNTNYDGEKYYVTDETGNVSKYFYISYPDGTINPLTKNPFKPGFMFKHWAFDSVKSEIIWDGNAFPVKGVAKTAKQARGPVTLQNQNYYLFAVWDTIDTLPVYCEGDLLDNISLYIDDTSTIVPGTEKWILAHKDGSRDLPYQNLSEVPSLTVAENDQDTLYYQVEVYCPTGTQVLSNSVIITVLPVPNIAFNDTAICEGMKMDLTKLSLKAGIDTTGTDIVFNYFTEETCTQHVSDSTSVDQGLYYIVGITQGGCSDTTSVTVTVNAKPEFSFTTPSAVCSPNTVDLMNLAVAAGDTTGLMLKYYTDNTYATEVSDATQATAGTYYIIGTDANGCSDSTSVTVTVNAKPEFSVTAPAAICSPNTVDLTNLAVAAGDTTGLTLKYYTDNTYATEVSDATQVTAGTYYIIGTDANGCSDSTSVVVTVNPKPEFSFTAPSAVCSPSTVDLTNLAVAAGDTTGLTLKYYTDNTYATEVSDATQATAGTYYIIGTDANTCSDSTSVTVTIHAKPEFSFTAPAAVCSPNTVDLTNLTVAAGDTTGLTLKYYTDNTYATEVSDATQASAGTYYIIGRDANGCSDSTSVTVTVNAKPEFSFTTPAAVCSPNAVDLTNLAVAAGDTTGLTLKYYTDNTYATEVSDATQATAGTYYIIGTDANTCSDSTSVTVTIHAKPEFSVTAPAAICSPNTVDLTNLAVAAGDTTGLTLKYYTDNTYATEVSDATQASAGTYYIIGTDANGCSDSTSVTVTINPKPEFSFTAPSAVCSPNTVDLTNLTVAAGDTTGLTLKYYTDNTYATEVSDATQASAGTYYIIGRDANGCSDSTSVTVTVNPKPEFSFTAPSAVCSPSTVDLTNLAVAAGDTTGLTLKYYTDNTYSTEVSDATQASAGTYYIIGTDANTCSDTTSVTVTVNPKPEFSFTAPSAVCSPNTVDLTNLTVAAGDTTGLTLKYYIDNTYSTEVSDATQASAGTYYIIGTDVNGCSDSTSVTVTVNPKPEFSFTTPAAVCSPNTVDLTNLVIAAGDTTGLTLKYYTDNTYATEVSDATQATAGTYYIIGTDVNGCSDSTSVTVTVNPKPEFSFTTPAAVCSPNTVDLTNLAVAAGDTTGLTLKYYIDNTYATEVSDATQASAGTYYIIGRDVNGCSDSTSVTVTVNPKPEFSFTTPAAVCSPNTVDLTNLAVAAGDTTGLTLKYYIDNTYATEVSDATQASAGTYYIIGRDANGCSDSTSVTVTVNPKPEFSFTTPAAVCSPSTVDLTNLTVAAGDTTGLTLKYYTDNTYATEVSDATQASAGTYYIIGTDANGCSDSTSVTVTVNAKPEFSFMAPAAICSPNTVDLTNLTVAAGDTTGLTLKYYTDNTYSTEVSDATQASAGTYYIIGRDANGCSDSTSVTVTVNPKPEFSFTTPAAVCSPNTVDLTNLAVAAGDTTGLTLKYYIDNTYATEVSDATQASAGTYYIIGRDANGCSDSTSVTVTVNPKPEFSFTTPAAVCSPNTVDLTNLAVAAGDTTGLTLKYYTNNTYATEVSDATQASAGTYYIIGTDANGCSDSTSVTVTVNPKPEFSFTTPAAVCSPNTVDLTALEMTSAGNKTDYDFTYFSDATCTTVVPNSEATITGPYYIIGVLKSTGCSDTATVNVTINGNPTLVFTAPAAVCSPNTVDLTVLEMTSAGNKTDYDFTYFSDATCTTVVPNSEATITGPYYIIGVLKSTGCSDTATVNVTINGNPTLVFTAPAAVCSPNTVDLTALEMTSAGNKTDYDFTYFSDATCTIVVPNSEATITGPYYIIGVLKSTGCSDTATVNIIVNEVAITPITGIPSVCKGSTTQLESETLGGKWHSTHPNIATVDANTGKVTGVADGTSRIYYVVTEGLCKDSVFMDVKVSESFDAGTIVGINRICQGSSGLLTNARSYGYWYSVDESIATVDAGLVTGIRPGTVKIYFKVGSGDCADSTFKEIIVDVKPEFAFENPDPVCTPSTVDLTKLSFANGNANGLIFNYFLDPTCITHVNDSTKIAVGGDYYIIGTNSNGCTDTAMVAVNIMDLGLQPIEGTPSVCLNSTSQLNCEPVGGKWYSDNNLIAEVDENSGLVTGKGIGLATIYYVLDNGQCKDSVNVTFEVAESFLAGGIVGDLDICVGSTTRLSNTRSNGSWRSEDESIAIVNTIGLVTGIKEGITTIYYKVGNGNCADSTSVEVTVQPKPEFSFVSPAAVCSPTTIDLTILPLVRGNKSGLTFNYFTNSECTTHVNDSTAISTGGIYYIVGTNLSGCTDTAMVKVTINDKPSFAVSNLVVCQGESVDLTDGVSSISLNSDLRYYSDRDLSSELPNTIVDPAILHTYYIHSTNIITGCPSDTISLEVRLNGVPTATLSGDASICEGSSTDLTILFTGTKPWNISYTNGSNQYTINNIEINPYKLTVMPSQTTIYSITDVSSGNCVGTFAGTPTVIVNPIPVLPLLDISGDTLIKKGTFTMLSITTNLSNSDTIRWYDSSFGSILGKGTSFTTPSLTENTIYNLKLVSAAGCISTNSQSVKITIKDEVVLVPEAITPNDDNVNDKLIIEGIENFPNNTIHIYSRWGDMVYQLSGYNNTDKVWSGESDRKLVVGSGKVPIGTYFYVLELNDASKTVLRGFIEVRY